MTFRNKRRGMRRPRWFRPLQGSSDTRIALVSPDTGIQFSPVAKGNAPFTGDAGGRGLPLAELQRFTHIRTVGKIVVSYWEGVSDGGSFDGIVQHDFGLGMCVVETDDLGAPKTDLPDPLLEADEDERWLQKWRVRHQSPVRNDPAVAKFYAQLDINPPYEGFIDVTQRRRMRNEENLFWLWRWRSWIFTTAGGGTASDPEYTVEPMVNISYDVRTLWAFN